jgi:N-acyl-D-amino-acid deacylase
VGVEQLPVTGRADPRLASFDRLMTRFMRKHRIPGAALAVAHNGRMVYARGFGFADRDDKQPVQPDSLFRIASVSKPLTAVAVLQLIERGHLKFDDPVFEILKLQRPARRFDARWKKVTILHLLQHRGGWDRDKASLIQCFARRRLSRN